ncbi:27020_t:CDS:1, partial [Gigaspora margarita]
IAKNKTHDLITQEFYCQDKISLEKAYKDWNKEINHAKEIYVKKDKHKAFKDYERSTKLNKQT